MGLTKILRAWVSTNLKTNFSNSSSLLVVASNMLYKDLKHFSDRRNKAVWNDKNNGLNQTGKLFNNYSSYFLRSLSQVGKLWP